MLPIGKSALEHSGEPHNTNTATSQHLPLCLVLFAMTASALLYRVEAASGYLHKGDAIVIGFMAEQIANGVSFPLVYAGQYYMGALEAWLMAPLYFLFKPGWWMISFEPIVVSSLGVIPFYLLGSAVAGRMAGLFASALWAITPFAITFYAITPRGCYPEVVCGGAALLWFTTEKWNGKTFGPWLYACMGALAGILLWTSFLSTPFIITAAIVFIIRERWRIFTGVNRWLLAGLAISSLPFLMTMTTYGFQSPGHVGLDRFLERLEALYFTAKWLFIPYPDEAPPVVVTVAAWFSFGFYTLSILIIPLTSIIYLLRSGKRSLQTPLFPLILFTIIFLSLYISNSESIRQQSRYLLPLVISFFIFASLILSMIYARSKAFAMALLAVLLLCAAGVNRLTFDYINKDSAQMLTYFSKVINDAKKNDIKSLVLLNRYNESYQMAYLAKTMGVAFNTVPDDGSRFYNINNDVEMDPDVAVLLNKSQIEYVVKGFSSCCSAGYEMVKIGDWDVIRHIKTKRWLAKSIPPDQWNLPENLAPLGDRKFTTTHHSSGSFTVELKEPKQITRIRAIYGRRQPQSTAIKVSLNGHDWVEVASPAPASVFVPYGPKVFLRVPWEWEREFQEWNFPPVKSRFIRFEIVHPKNTEYDIHELFIYSQADEENTGKIDKSNEAVNERSYPKAQDILRKIREDKISVVAANRWYTAKLYPASGKDFKLILPSLRGFGSASLRSSRIIGEENFAALVDSSDAGELAERLASNTTQFHIADLGSNSWVAFKSGTGTLWWTGFTLIDY